MVVAHMEIIFDRGDQKNPKGHALIYFRNSSNTEELWASYLVILPMMVDLSKYLPPFLLSQVEGIGSKELSAFAFPPGPEKVEGFKYLEDMASLRGDDIVFGGTFDPTDVSKAMMVVNDGLQKYADAYLQKSSLYSRDAPLMPKDMPELPVNEVLYGMMSDHDKLKELTKLIGKLRFAVERYEEKLVKEAESEVEMLASHLPSSYKIPRLLDVAKARKGSGEVLADLYLKRCFCLIGEEYVKLGEVEDKIKALELQDSPQ